MKKFAEVKFQVAEAIEEQDRAESDENQAPDYSGKAAMHNPLLGITQDCDTQDLGMNKSL